jgi:DNA polymerase kappa
MATTGTSSQTTSLVHRLAGPSTGKAGYVTLISINTTLLLTLRRLATDQSKINSIIADASKGSKFYEASHGDLEKLI